jgi:hypothetical protein
MGVREWSEISFTNYWSRHTSSFTKILNCFRSFHVKKPQWRLTFKRIFKIVMKIANIWKHVAPKTKSAEFITIQFLVFFFQSINPFTINPLGYIFRWYILIMSRYVTDYINNSIDSSGNTNPPRLFIPLWYFWKC